MWDKNADSLIARYEIDHKEPLSRVSKPSFMSDKWLTLLMLLHFLWFSVATFLFDNRYYAFLAGFALASLVFMTAWQRLERRQ